MTSYIMKYYKSGIPSEGVAPRVWFSPCLDFPDSVDDSKFIPVFKQRVRDQYLTVWNAKVLVSSSLQFYKEICPINFTATYLHKIVNLRYTRPVSCLFEQM